MAERLGRTDFWAAVCGSVMGLLFASACPAAVVGGPAGSAGSAEPVSAPPETSGYDPAIAFLKLADIGPLPQKPAAGTTASATSPRALKQIEKARELFHEQRYTEASQALERALRYSPTSLEAHALMGRVALEAGNSAQAKDHLRKAVEINGQSSRLHFLLGKAYVLEEAWDRALAEFRVVNLCDDHRRQDVVAALAHYYLAQALQELGYFTAAIDSYTAFIASSQELGAADPLEDPLLLSEIQAWQLSACLNQSRLHETLGQLEPAAEVLQEAIAQDPQNPEHLRRLVALYVQADQPEEAAAAARGLFPIDPQGLKMLADIRRQAGQRQALLEDLGDLAERHPDRPEVVQMLAEALIEEGQVDQAEAVLSRFLQDHADDGDVAVALAGLQSQQARCSAALATLGGVISRHRAPQEIADRWLEELESAAGVQEFYEAVVGRLDQGDLDYGQAYLIGRLAASLGRSPRAKDAYLACASTAPEFAEAHLALAELYIDEYQWDAAIEAAGKAVQLDAHSGRGHRLLGRAHMGLDHYEQAEQSLLNALRFDRDDVGARHALAEVYDYSAAPLKAKKQLQTIVEIKPHDGRALEALFFRALIERKPDQAGFYLQALKDSAANQSRYRRCAAVLQFNNDGDADAFVSNMQEIMAAFPQDVDNRVQLAAFLIDGEHMPELLEEQLTRIAELDPSQPDGLRLRARWQSANLQFVDAADSLRDLLKRHPNRTHWQRELISTLIDDQLYAPAAEMILQLLAREDLRAELRPVLRYDVIMCLVLQGRVEQALELLHSWLAAAGDDLMTLRAIRVRLARMAGSTAQAVELAEGWYRQASLEQSNTARSLLVYAYQAAEQYDDAAAALLERLELDPEDPRATRELVMLYRDAGMHQQAIELARASALAQASQTRKLEYETLLLGVYANAKRYDEALRLNRALMADLSSLADRPAMGMAGQLYHNLRLELCRTLLNAGRYDAAERELTTWLQEHPRQDLERDVISLLSFCYQLNGKKSLSIQQLEKLCELDPQDAGCNNDLGYTWAVNDMNLERAERMIRRALADDPRSAAYLDSFGWALYKQGDFEGAYHWLSRAAVAPTLPWRRWLLDARTHEQGRHDPVIQDHQGDSAWRLGKTQQAIDHWQLAVELAGKETGALITPEVALLPELAAAKIEAAKSDRPPKVASSATDR